MEISRFFKCMCHFVKCRFIEMFTDNLQADRQSIRKSAWYRNGWYTSKVDWYRQHIIRI